MANIQFKQKNSVTPSNTDSVLGMRANGDVVRFPVSSLKSSSDGGGSGWPFSDRVVYIAPENASDIHDTISDLESKGGGTIYLDAGEYIIDRPIVINGAINLIGAGRKVTVIKATTDKAMGTFAASINKDKQPSGVTSWETDDVTAIIALTNTARYITISDLTIYGNRFYIKSADHKVAPTTYRALGYGAEFGIIAGGAPNPSGLGDYGDYSDESTRVLSSFTQNKNIYIHNCIVKGCDVGLYQGKYKYLFHVSHCWFKGNGIGGYIAGDDSEYDSCEVERNAFYGWYGSGGNLKTSNFKVLWNGLLSGETEKYPKLHGSLTLCNGKTDTPSFSMRGVRCLVNNIEVQDAYANCFDIRGDGHCLIGLHADSSSPYKGDSSAIAGTTPAFGCGSSGTPLTGTILIAKVTNSKNVTTPWSYSISLSDNSVGNTIILNTSDGCYKTAERNGGAGQFIEPETSIHTLTVTSGKADVSNGNKFYVPSGSNISEIVCDSLGSNTQSKTVTFVFLGTATVTHGSNILLNGGSNFSAKAYSTLTLTNYYSSGWKWVETSRSTQP